MATFSYLHNLASSKIETHGHYQLSSHAQYYHHSAITTIALIISSQPFIIHITGSIIKPRGSFTTTALPPTRGGGICGEQPRHSLGGQAKVDCDWPLPGLLNCLLSGRGVERVALKHVVDIVTVL